MISHDFVLNLEINQDHFNNRFAQLNIPIAGKRDKCYEEENITDINVVASFHVFISFSNHKIALKEDIKRERERNNGYKDFYQ